MTANRCKGLGKPPAGGSTSMMSTVMVTVTTCNQKEKIQRHMSIVEAKAQSSQYSGDTRTCCFLRVIKHITALILPTEDIVLNHNNNNNSQSMNNNSAAKSFDKSTQTSECGDCKVASEKLLMEKSVAVETQTDFTNLHNDSICCLNRIPYADMSNSPISRSLSYQCDKTKTSMDNCNESLNGSNEDVSLTQPPAKILPNNVDSSHTTNSVVAKDTAEKCQANKGVDIL